MPILNDFKMVGVSIPRPLFDKLNLFCVAENTNKSALMRDNVMEILKTCDESDLIYKITEKLQILWKDSDMTESRFQSEIREELSKKGLNEFHINLLLKSISYD